MKTNFWFKLAHTYIKWVQNYLLEGILVAQSYRRIFHLVNVTFLNIDSFRIFEVLNKSFRKVIEEDTKSQQHHYDPQYSVNTESIAIE